MQTEMNPSLSPSSDKSDEKNARHVAEHRFLAAQEFLDEDNLDGAIASFVDALNCVRSDVRCLAEITDKIRLRFLLDPMVGDNGRSLLFERLGQSFPLDAYSLVRAIYHHFEGSIRESIQFTSDWLGSMRDPEQRFQRVLDLLGDVPDFIPGHMYTIRFYLDLGQEEPAKKALRTALKEDKGERYITKLRAFAHEISGTAPKARPGVATLSVVGPPLQLLRFSVVDTPDTDILARQDTWDHSIAVGVIGKDRYRTLEWPSNFDPKIIIDIGAHIGSFATWVGGRYPNAKVLAYEVLGNNWELLCRNAGRLRNIEASCTAIGGHEFPIAVHESAIAQNTGGAWVEFGSVSEPAISFRTLDDICEEWKIDKIDFLKIDCEGSEFAILDHAASTGAIQKVGRLAIKVHLNPDPASNRSLERIEKALEGFDEVEIVEGTSDAMKMVFARRSG